MREQGLDVAYHSVCYEYALMSLVNKKSALAYGMAEYSQAGKMYRKWDWSQRDAKLLPKEKDTNWTLTSKTHGDTQIDRNGLIQDVRAS